MKQVSLHLATTELWRELTSIYLSLPEDAREWMDVDYTLLLEATDWADVPAALKCLVQHGKIEVAEAGKNRFDYIRVRMVRLMPYKTLRELLEEPAESLSHDAAGTADTDRRRALGWIELARRVFGRLRR